MTDEQIDALANEDGARADALRDEIVQRSGPVREAFAAAGFGVFDTSTIVLAMLGLRWRVTPQDFARAMVLLALLNAENLVEVMP